MLNRITKNFTIAPNELINDTRLSIQARFLFIYLCSKPSDWTFRNKVIENDLNISKDSRLKYTNELKNSGWLTVDQIKNKGSFGGNQYVLQQSPEILPKQEKPYTENQAAEINRGGKNQLHNNTNINTNTNNNTNTNKNKGEEIKNFSDSNFSDLKLFDELPDQKQKEKKVAPKKEKIGKEIIFPLVKKLAGYFPDSITTKLSANDKKNWCETVEKLLRIDGYTESEIVKAVKDARKHNFWKDNFLSLTKLRKKKDNVTYIQKFLLLNGSAEITNDGSGNFQEIKTDESMLT